MRHLQRRLAKLEARREAEAQGQSHVIYLDVYGCPEDLRYLDGGGPWLFLPHKSTSVGNRSGCENLSLVVTSLSAVPCRHGNTGGIIIRPLGADPTRSAGLYSGA